MENFGTAACVSTLHLEMLWLLPLIASATGVMDKHFHVSHIVRSLDSIYTVCNVTRDGQFYGSYGYYWPSSGGEDAAYIHDGKAFQINFQRHLKVSGPSYAVAWKAPSSVYVRYEGGGGVTYECKVNNRGEALSLRETNYKGGWTSLPSSVGTATYNPQQDTRWYPDMVGEEYLAPKSVPMYSIGHGYKVGDVRIEVNMVTEYGVCVHLPDGRTLPLTGRLKQLKGFTPRRLLAVGKEGWFAIEAIKTADKEWPRYVIWIEPKIKLP